MWQGAYTPESLAAQIKDPQDRMEAVRPAFEAMGGRDPRGRLSARRV